MTDTDHRRGVKDDTGNPQTCEEGMRLAKESGASQVRRHVGFDANRRHDYHEQSSLPGRGDRQQGNTWNDRAGAVRDQSRIE
ncbi:hypothetical protein R1flu_004796 [Riccia fluitans]|uniref:Uncharacterized protein n=1 Tax=Riccia fluitans TaxID=41844 RepID=A0ABD1YRB2_9MARC